MCFKPSMMHYTLNLSNIRFFNILPNEVEHIDKKKEVILYNTFNIHENATLPLFIFLKYFFFEKVLQIM
jgi:hypothetical protein